jgi:flagellar biosynthesis anti-sigma factor FlgM
VDTGKVTQIRQQIAEGSYRIDATEIADRLIAAAREFFTRRH